MEEKFHDALKRKIHEYIMLCYQIMKQFPPNERFGIQSQLGRASVSIMLNYVEGYARRRDKVKLNFFEIAHGSTQECKYIIYFSFCQQWITNAQYQQLLGMVDEIAKMMWTTIDKLEKTINK